jgi:ribose 5-phosphate isomerase A
MSWIDAAKRRASEKAVEHVDSGSIIGLGSGSTAAKVIRLIGSQLKSGELEDILGVPTSLQAADEAIKAGIPLTSLDEHPEIDIAIDGADQIDGKLNAVKGGGGALLREKVVASVSNRFIIVTDETKLTEQLGSGCRVPVEVLPFAARPILNRIVELGAKAQIRTGAGRLGPVLTDNGNLIVDAEFGAIEDPWKLEENLKSVPGIIETGLFLGYAEFAYIGIRRGVKRLDRSSGLRTVSSRKRFS